MWWPHPTILVVMTMIMPVILLAQGPTASRKLKKGRSYGKIYAHPINTSFSVEARLGLAAYTGELASLKDASLQNNYGNLAWGVGLDYRLTHFIKFALKAKRIKLASESEPEFWNNRSFSTKGNQFTFSIEHNIFPHGFLEDLDQRANVYFSAGIGVLFYETTVQDPPNSPNTIKDNTMIFPLGVGVTYFLNRTTHLAIEGHFYETSSDELDGTPSSGDKSDAYFLLEVKYCWQIASGFAYKRHLKRLGR